jgi:hypothetical protein
MPLGQPWLLTEPDPQMESNDDSKRINQQADRAECNGPAEQDDGHGHIHWIAAVSVEADNHQVLRRSPRGECALAGHVEVPDAPQQTHCPEHDKDQADGPVQRKSREPGPCDRHKERHDPGQRQKRNGSSREDWCEP